MIPGSHMATMGGLSGGFMWGQGLATLPPFPQCVLSCCHPALAFASPKASWGTCLCLPRTVNSFFTGSLSLSCPDLWVWCPPGTSASTAWRLGGGGCS